MSDKAKELIQQTLKEYQEEDETSRQSAYRDLITDLLHSACKDYKLRAEMGYDENNEEPFLFITDLEQQIYAEAKDMWKEEKEREEWDILNALNKEELPLYVNREWNFDSTKELFEQRLKDGK